MISNDRRYVSLGFLRFSRRSSFRMPISMDWTQRIQVIALMLLVGTGTFSFAGCGGPSDPLNRQAVSGEVTLNNQPLDNGSISFDPEDRENGRPGGATIADGKFTIDRERGLPPGTYTVRVNSADSVKESAGAAGEPGESRRQLPKERIPADWNTKSDQTITVVDGEDNSFQFAIP